MGEDWLTLKEAATYLKVSQPTLYRLCAQGHLPFYKLAAVGGRRFKRADLDALLRPGRAGDGHAATSPPSDGASHRPDGAAQPSPSRR